MNPLSVIKDFDPFKSRTLGIHSRLELCLTREPLELSWILDLSVLRIYEFRLSSVAKKG